jgi:predicted metal-binding membrane protein
MALAVAVRRPPRVLVVAIAAAWTLAIVVQASGNSQALHHDWLISGELPIALSIGLFLVAWQVHLAAMMLPSSLPMIALFSQASAGQPSSGRARAAFLGGCASVWTVFGAVAFVGDIALHGLVHRWEWLGSHRWLITGSVLAVAGLFQFSDVKDRCLQQCRHPGAFMLRHYERGVGGAFRMGKRHGLFCLGCCWALMLLMFSVGVANLLWMAPLAVVMYLEKTSAKGAELTRAVGLVLIALAGVVFAQPMWRALGG